MIVYSRSHKDPCWERLSFGTGFSMATFDSIDWRHKKVVFFFLLKERDEKIIKSNQIKFDAKQGGWQKKKK